MEKTLRRQWNIPLWFIAPVEKPCFYERFLSEGVMVMVKDKKIQYKIYLVYLNLHGSIPVDAKIKIV